MPTNVTDSSHIQDISNIIEQVQCDIGRIQFLLKFSHEIEHDYEVKLESLMADANRKRKAANAQLLDKNNEVEWKEGVETDAIEAEDAMHGMLHEIKTLHKRQGHGHKNFSILTKKVTVLQTALFKAAAHLKEERIECMTVEQDDENEEQDNK